MDELKNLWNTGTGKVLISIVTALILFLGALSYKGLFSDTKDLINANKEDTKELINANKADTDALIKENKTLIVINKANITANAKAIESIRMFTQKSIENINTNINSINTKLSNIDGYIKGVEKGEQKKR